MTHKSTTIYLVRHGQSTTNLAGIIGGQNDPELTNEGRNQAKKTKAALSDVKFDEVYSSDLQRASETAAIIFGQKAPLSHQLSDLRERSYGSLEGKSYQHFDSYYAALLGLPLHKRETYRHVEDMENDQELVTRYMRALETIAGHNTGKKILVVGHGAAIRTVLVRLGFARYEDLPPRSFKNAGYVELVYDGQALSVRRIEGIDKKIVDKNKV
jgi:probable phosphoglycerate mutase